MNAISWQSCALASASSLNTTVIYLVAKIPPKPGGYITKHKQNYLS